MRIGRVVGIVVLVAAGVAGALFVQRNGREAATPAQAAPRTVPVMAAAAETQDLSVVLRGLGAVTAYNNVSLTSRVEGNITEVNFKEGQTVHTGDVLIQLDPRPYQAVLDQAKAALARDQANLANAKLDLDRYSTLAKRDFATKQQVDTQTATVTQSAASSQADEAAIRSAELNLGYAALRSPIDGITGIRHVDIGNLVQASSGQNLVTITQIEPIYVVFTLAEADIDRIRAAMAKGKLPVQAFTADDQKKIADGELDLIDNTVDQTTGTVRLKAEFSNSDHALWPGQFVNAHLLLETIKDAVTIPATSVQTGPDGSYAYVITPDSKVEQRKIDVGQTEAGRAWAREGLNAGEKVVTAGQFQLEPGARVAISDQIANADKQIGDAPLGTTGSKE